MQKKQPLFALLTAAVLAAGGMGSAEAQYYMPLAALNDNQATTADPANSATISSGATSTITFTGAAGATFTAATPNSESDWSYFAKLRIEFPDDQWTDNCCFLAGTKEFTFGHLDLEAEEDAQSGGKRYFYYIDLSTAMSASDLKSVPSYGFKSTAQDQTVAFVGIEGVVEKLSPTIEFDEDSWNNDQKTYEPLRKGDWITPQFFNQYLQLKSGDQQLPAQVSYTLFVDGNDVSGGYTLTKPGKCRVVAKIPEDYVAQDFLNGVKLSAASVEFDVTVEKGAMGIIYGRTSINNGWTLTKLKELAQIALGKANNKGGTPYEGELRYSIIKDVDETSYPPVYGDSIPGIADTYAFDGTAAVTTNGQQYYYIRVSYDGGDELLACNEVLKCQYNAAKQVMIDVPDDGYEVYAGDQFKPTAPTIIDGPDGLTFEYRLRTVSNDGTATLGAPLKTDGTDKFGTAPLDQLIDYNSGKIVIVPVIPAAEQANWTLDPSWNTTNGDNLPNDGARYIPNRAKQEITWNVPTNVSVNGGDPISDLFTKYPVKGYKGTLDDVIVLVNGNNVGTLKSLSENFVATFADYDCRISVQANQDYSPANAYGPSNEVIAQVKVNGTEVPYTPTVKDAAKFETEKATVTLATLKSWVVCKGETDNELTDVPFKVYIDDVEQTDDYTVPAKETEVTLKYVLGEACPVYGDTYGPQKVTKKIKVGPTTGLCAPAQAVQEARQQRYDLSGRPVGTNHKGLYIQGGKLKVSK